MDPAALIEVINEAQAAREAARRTGDRRELTEISEAEVHAMIDSFGDVGAALNGGKPESLARHYEGLRLQLRYESQEQAVDVAASPRVVSTAAAECDLGRRVMITKTATA